MKKQNVKNQMLPHRNVNLIGTIVLTLIALVAVSIFGPTTNPSGKVKAFATLPVTLDQSQIDAITDPGTVPGTLTPAQYVSGGMLTGNTTSCDTLFTVDSGFTPDSAPDHHWIQADGESAIIYNLAAPSSNVIVFPSIDHNLTPQGHPAFEALEFTVWGLPVGAITPSAFTPSDPWVLGKLERVYAQGWQPNNCSTLESDDHASVWQFLDASNNPVNVQFIAIYANESVLFTPFTSLFDDRNLPNAEVNSCISSGTYFCSDDAEIDAVATSSAIQGCIDPACTPPPPSQNLCSYTKGGYAGRGTPGQLFNNNFISVFLGGLTIGINDGAGPLHSAVWQGNSTGKANLKTYLNSSAGTTSGLLTTDYLNATSTTGGQLPRQTATLTLNVAFSNAGVTPGGFGSQRLCNLVAGSQVNNFTLTAAQAAALNGKTVNDILTDANTALASGILPNYVSSFGNLNEIVTALNESFDNCTRSAFATSYLCQ